jgi:cytochrome b561
MPYLNTPDQYGFAAKGLHWLIAALIIALLGIGWWMVDLSYYDPWYHDALNWHKSLGIILGLLVIFKLLWNLYDKPPRPQANLSGFERGASRFVHSILRWAILIIPITGFLVSTSEGAAVDVFNWFSVPAFMQVDDSARDTAINIHYYFAYALMALVALHAAAAIKHQFIDKKGTLKRMS